MWAVISLTGVRMKETGAGHAGRDDCLRTWRRRCPHPSREACPRWHGLGLAPRLGGSKFPLFKAPGPQYLVMAAWWPTQGPM